MDSLHREYSREHEKYSRERQELRTKLQQALSSQEVCSDPGNLPLPGLYQQSMMGSAANVTPMMASMASMPATTIAPPGSVILDNVEAFPTGEMVSHLATASAAPPQPQAASVTVPTAAPPMTSSVAMTSSLTPLQYAAVLPGSRYQIQVNPNGSHQVIHVQQPQVQQPQVQQPQVQQPPNGGGQPLTVVTTASSSSTT